MQRWKCCVLKEKLAQEESAFASLKGAVSNSQVTRADLVERLSQALDLMPSVVAWLHEVFQADHILVYEIMSETAADICARGYDDGRKWKSVTALHVVTLVTLELLRSPQALELSRPQMTFHVRSSRLSDSGVPNFTHIQTPILPPPELYAPGGSGKPQCWLFRLICSFPDCC